MIGLISRWAFRLTAALLTLGILVVGTFLVLVAVPDLARQTASDSAAPSATPAPTATPKSAMGLSPVGIEMPEGTNCSGCHVTTTGSVGTKPIPVMAHPLLGWRDCTACHTTGSLVATAPGHSSLHKDECLICHKTQDAAGTSTSAPARPEHMGVDGAACTSCHGLDTHAPLPESMTGRGNNCWICHNGPEFQYLFDSASPGPSGEPAGSADPSAPAASPAASAATGYVLGDLRMP